MKFLSVGTNRSCECARAGFDDSGRPPDRVVFGLVVERIRASARTSRV